MRLRFALVFAFTGLAACGGGVCGDDVDPEGDAPTLKNVDMLIGRVPGDPWNVVFVANFSDPDGDMGQGEAAFYLGKGEAPAITIGMQDAFRQSALPADAESGKITMPLRFSEATNDDSEVDVGVQLIDGDDHKSNCYSLSLHFGVK